MSCIIPADLSPSDLQSSSDLNPELVQEVVSNPVDLPPASDPVSTPNSGSRRPEFHQSESFGSILSESVFLSETETSLKGDMITSAEPALDTPKSSNEVTDCKEKVLLEMMLMDGRYSILF